jgi:hypothetical protein
MGRKKTGIFSMEDKWFPLSKIMFFTVSYKVLPLFPWPTDKFILELLNHLRLPGCGTTKQEKRLRRGPSPEIKRAGGKIIGSLSLPIL